jgi:hypothetical protein
MMRTGTHTQLSPRVSEISAVMLKSSVMVGLRKSTESDLAQFQDGRIPLNYDVIQMSRAWHCMLGSS